MGIPIMTKNDVRWNRSQQQEPKEKVNWKWFYLGFISGTLFVLIFLNLVIYITGRI